MKSTFKKTMLLLVCVGVLVFSACDKTELTSFDREFTGIYFQQDSLYYSFGVTPLDIMEYEWQVPLRIMGEPHSQNRVFAVEIDSESTTAQAGVHFRVPERLTVQADSVNAYIPVTIIRSTLGVSDFKLSFILKENEAFVPVNEPFKSTSLYFNNRVERPSWKDFRGQPAWPSQLGQWNPTTYIKFIELFREIEEKSPTTYYNMVTQFGPDLANVPFGWPWDYNFTMIKYVLIPMYQYFVEQHPELGITIPRPSGY